MGKFVADRQAVLRLSFAAIHLYETILWKQQNLSFSGAAST
jgi:hypothetical protein